MAIQESGEMYLENILVLQKQKGEVRSIDVAHYSGYSKPSVSRAMNILKKDGLITIDQDGFIHFTNTGYQIAHSIYERHVVLTRFLTAIGVDEKVAAEDACKIEHDLSSETFERLKEHIAKTIDHKEA